MEYSPVYLLWPYLVHGLELPASCLAHLGQAEPGIVLGHVHLEGEGEGEGFGSGLGVKIGLGLGRGLG